MSSADLSGALPAAVTLAEADGSFIVLIFVGAFVLIGDVIALSLYLEAQRAKALARLADEMGLTFSRANDPHLLGELHGTHLHSKGTQKRAYNAIRGTTADTDVAIFEYSYTVESTNSNDQTNSSTTHTQTIVRFRSPHLRLPSFSLRPKNFFHRIGTLFGYQAVTFDDAPKFSSRWLLRCADEAAVRQLFRPEVLSFFEEERGLGVEGHDSGLWVYREDRRLAPQAIRAFLEEAWQVFALLREPETR